jgi:hypothetical protein
MDASFVLENLKASIVWLNQQGLLDDAKALTAAAAGKLYNFIKDKLFSGNSRAQDNMDKLKSTPDNGDYERRVLTYLEAALEDNKNLHAELQELLDKFKTAQGDRIIQNANVNITGNYNIAFTNVAANSINTKQGR